MALAPFAFAGEGALALAGAAQLGDCHATQVDILRRLRNGSSQVVRVEHVHVNEGGQAVIGNLETNKP